MTSATLEAFLFSIRLFISAVGISLILVYFLKRISLPLGLMDVPGSEAHKKHSRQTPKTGGIVLALSLAIIALLYGKNFSNEVFAIWAGGAVVFFFGLIDDIWSVGVAVKFLGQIVAATLLIYFGIKVEAVQFLDPGTNAIANLIITFFWLIGITNAFNLIDSADSLAISQALLTTGFLLLGSLIAGQEQLGYQSIVLLGIGAILLFFNLSPAQLFLGDSGAQTLGFLLASFAILYNPVIQPQSSSWFVPITFVMVPIFDVCLVFFSRFRRRLPFYQADLNHTYHRLVAGGFSPLRAVSAMGFVAGFAGLLGLVALYQPPVFANLIFAGILLGGVIVFYHLDVMSNKK